MKRILFSLFITLLSATSCQKEKITLGIKASDTFYVENNGASMHVLVAGNTIGKVFILFVHGGPGLSSLLYRTDYIIKNLEDKYAVVYWDQRNAGASQGNSNGKKLNLNQMSDDLRKVIEVIKVRYGLNSKIFLMGHSFGGLLTTSFLTTGNNQSMVEGWIFADGSQNYPLNDTLTRQMLISVGNQQINLGKNKSQWEGIISYCNSHPGPFAFDESDQYQTYAQDAESYIDSVPKINQWAILKNNSIKYNWPLTSMLMNYLYSSEASFNSDLAKTRFTSSLYNVTIPVLILFGKYDFICPKELGFDLFNRIGSANKKIVISPVSGHDIMFQDEVLFCNEVNDFIGSII